MNRNWHTKRQERIRDEREGYTVDHFASHVPDSYYRASNVLDNLEAAETLNELFSVLSPFERQVVTLLFE